MSEKSVQTRISMAVETGENKPSTHFDKALLLGTKKLRENDSTGTNRALADEMDGGPGDEQFRLLQPPGHFTLTEMFDDLQQVRFLQG